nr:hypothetical protein [Rugamonas sp.]
MTLIAAASIIVAGITTSFGTMAPALAEGRAVAAALGALAQQPDAAATITRTLYRACAQSLASENAALLAAMQRAEKISASCCNN